MSYQLEMEFKKNRQAAMMEGIQELKAPQQFMSRPGLFSDAKAVQAITKSHKEVTTHAKKLRARYLKAFQKPTTSDPVYQIAQRIFHKKDPLVLTLESKERHLNRRKALRRFLLGCPPRKKGDTSMGDAINWEWMIECAISQNAELVIASRDSDYGTVFDNVAYVNDHLRQEFSERVSKRRKILLYHRLSDALEHFKIAVTEEEKREEKEAFERPRASLSAFLDTTSDSFDDRVDTDKWRKMIQAIYVVRDEVAHESERRKEDLAAYIEAARKALSATKKKDSTDPDAQP